MSECVRISFLRNNKTKTTQTSSSVECPWPGNYRVCQVNRCVYPVGNNNGQAGIRLYVMCYDNVEFYVQSTNDDSPKLALTGVVT